MKRWESLPFPGALMDQPEKLMQALEVVDEAFAEERDTDRAIAEARQAALSGGGHHMVTRRRRG